MTTSRPPNLAVLHRNASVRLRPVAAAGGGAWVNDTRLTGQSARVLPGPARWSGRRNSGGQLRASRRLPSTLMRRARKRSRVRSWPATKRRKSTGSKATRVSGSPRSRRLARSTSRATNSCRRSPAPSLLADADLDQRPLSAGHLRDRPAARRCGRSPGARGAAVGSHQVGEALVVALATERVLTDTGEGRRPRTDRWHRRCEAQGRRNLIGTEPVKGHRDERRRRLQAPGDRRQRDDRLRARGDRRPRPPATLLLARSDASAWRAEEQAVAACAQGRRRRRLEAAGDHRARRPRRLRPRRRGGDRGRRGEGRAARRRSAAPPPDADLATTTSSLSVGEIGGRAAVAERVFGLHVFNPVPRMKLVELCFPEAVADGVRERALAWCAALGKTAVEVPDQAGFVVNRLLFPYLFDAVRLLERTGMSPGEVDSCMTLGAGHPMGPLALLDFVGLDVAEAIGDALHADSGEAAHRAAGPAGRMVGRASSAARAAPASTSTTSRRSAPDRLSGGEAAASPGLGHGRAREVRRRARIRVPRDRRARGAVRAAAPGRAERRVEGLVQRRLGRRPRGAAPSCWLHSEPGPRRRASARSPTTWRCSRRCPRAPRPFPGSTCRSREAELLGEGDASRLARRRRRSGLESEFFETALRPARRAGNRHERGHPAVRARPSCTGTPTRRPSR